MRIAVFSTKSYDEEFLIKANQKYGHELEFFEVRLNIKTAPLAAGFTGICVFVNDILNREVLQKLYDNGTRLIALRCAGFNNVDIATAIELGIKVVRVPAYSPFAVAEHTMALILSLNRKIHRAYQHVREGNFSLTGLLGFDINGLTAGVVGTGRIGQITSRILNGFNCNVLAYDPCINPECKKWAEYVELDELFSRSDIITLHCPLMPSTHHLIDANSIKIMKDGVMLINTSRGALIDTTAVINGLKSGKIGHLGLDVYEEEGDLFFEDLSEKVIQDDVFTRLLTFPNVIITGHQAFFTKNALENISNTTLKNITDVETNNQSVNEVSTDMIK